MVQTLADIAEELSARYEAVKWFLKKGEKSDVFLNILKRLFYEYGERFGFEADELSDFKSEVIQAKNNLHKRTKRFRFRKRFVVPDEGSGEEFTRWQIETLGLNPDSYY